MSIPDFSSENFQPSEQAVESETRSAALNRIREGENERLVLEVVVRKRLMWLGIVVGATVGLSVGYMATLVTIVDGGIGDFGFSFYRPNFVHGFLRIITAYILGGGFVGGAISYVLFTSRSEATSPIRWIIAGLLYGLGTPLLIGFLLPSTLLIFVDFIDGLRPGLWLSAFVETLLGSFLDGYIFMIKTLSAGFSGAFLFLAIFAVTYFVSQRVTLPKSLTRSVPASVVYYAAAAIIAVVPLVILVVGPFSLTSALASFLTGENV